MPRYDFVSPGGQAVDALTSFLAKEEADKRQKMIDAINAKNITSQIADRESNRRIQEENATSQAEVRAEQAQKARHEAYLKRVSQMDIGDEIDPELLKQAKEFGYGNDFGPAPAPKAPLPAPMAPPEAPAPPEGIAALPPPPPGMSSPVKSVDDTTQAPPATAGTPVQVVDAQTGDKLTFKNAADAEEFQRQNNMVKPEQSGAGGPPMGIPQGGPPPLQGPPPGMMSGPPSGPPPMAPPMPAQPPPGPSGPPLGMIAGPPPAPPKMVYKGSAQQRQRAAMTTAIAGAKDRVEAGRIAIEHGVPYNQVDDILNSMYGRKIDPEGASPNIPVYTQNSRNGTIEQVGDVPKGTHFMTEPPPIDNSAKEATRLDKSYQYNNNILEKSAAPIEAQAQRLERIQVSIAAKSPAADALIAPELLTAMAGGPGSGVRMNETEIARIVNGRSNWESIKAAVNKWRPGDAALSITDAQRSDISKLVNEMNRRANNRLQVLDTARADLIDAVDVSEHRRILQRVKKALTDTSEGSSGLPLGVTVEREK